jgi:predicted RNA-binding Zn ribbon-like protein
MTPATRNPAFELIAGHPALDLVNTLDWRFRQSEPEELLKSYADLLRFAEQSKMLTARQARQLHGATSDNAGMRVLSECRKLREAIAEILYAGLDGRTPSATSLMTVEHHFQAARGHRKLSWNESRLKWDWAEAETEAALPLWLLALSASRLLTSEEIRSVRACGSPECRWLFLDTSKNHTRRWCDMKICGNRMKARRFKAQRRA